MEKLIALNLKTKSGIYKLGSVIRGDDGSYYVIYPNNNWFKKTNAASVTPIKYSYHASGKRSRITVGSNKNRVAEFAEEIRKPVDSIEASEGMMYFSLFDIQNNIDKMLDIANKNRGYKEEIVIEGEQYANLTVRFFLANKSFRMNKPTKNYKEIFRVFQGTIDVIITTEDIWLGSDIARK